MPPMSPTSDLYDKLYDETGSMHLKINVSKSNIVVCQVALYVNSKYLGV